MAQVIPTKSNLLATKKSLELAKTGFDLMDKKKNILIREMMDLVDEAKKVQDEIGECYKSAFQALSRANRTLGDCASFSRAYPVDNSLELNYVSVMGVELPKITAEKKTVDVTSFGFENTNSDFDEACITFGKVKELTIRLAEIESSVFALADAVSKTQKRSNALSNVMIPRFEETVRYISSALDEKELEEFSKLKVIKGRK